RRDARFSERSGSVGAIVGQEGRIVVVEVGVRGAEEPADAGGPTATRVPLERRLEEIVALNDVVVAIVLDPLGAVAVAIEPRNDEIEGGGEPKPPRAGADEPDVAGEVSVETMAQSGSSQPERHPRGIGPPSEAIVIA